MRAVGVSVSLLYISFLWDLNTFFFEKKGLTIEPTKALSHRIS